MPRFCANISYLFKEVPLLERFELARQSGFSAVEILVPYTESPEKLAEAADRSGLPVVLINTPMGNLRDGGRGIASDPAQRDAFRVGLDKALIYAQALQVERINIIAGRVFPEDSHSTHLNQYIQNLQWAADRCDPLGIRVDVEAVNAQDIQGSLVYEHSVALDVIDRVDRANVDLQFDVYHTLKNGQNPARLFEQSQNKIGHIQFAEVPDRHEPGTGSTDFLALFELFDKTGYQGWVSAEYAPETTTHESLKWFQFPLQTR